MPGSEGHALETSPRLKWFLAPSSLADLAAPSPWTQMPFRPALRVNTSPALRGPAGPQRPSSSAEPTQARCSGSLSWSWLHPGHGHALCCRVTPGPLPVSSAFKKETRRAKSGPAAQRPGTGFRPGGGLSPFRPTPAGPGPARHPTADLTHLSPFVTLLSSERWSLHCASLHGFVSRTEMLPRGRGAGRPPCCNCRRSQHAGRQGPALVPRAFSPFGAENITGPDVSCQPPMAAPLPQRFHPPEMLVTLAVQREGGPSHRCCGRRRPGCATFISGEESGASASEPAFLCSCRAGA